MRDKWITKKSLHLFEILISIPHAGQLLGNLELISSCELCGETRTGGGRRRENFICTALAYSVSVEQFFRELEHTQVKTHNTPIVDGAWRRKIEREREESTHIFNKVKKRRLTTLQTIWTCARTYRRTRARGPIHTSSTALMQPSFSGLLVTCAYLPHTTLPEGVTRPRSEQLTSMMVPLVITPD